MATNVTIYVVNRQIGCDNEVYQIISANPCDDFLVQLVETSVGTGPFDIFIDSLDNTPIETGISRENLIIGITLILNCNTPTFTPTPTITPGATIPFTPTPTKTATQTPTPSQTIGSTPPVTPTPTQTRTQTPTNTTSVTSTPTNTISQTPTTTTTLTATPTRTARETQTPTQTRTQTPTSTPSNTVSQTPTRTPGATANVTPTPTNTISQTPSKTAAITVTPTQTITQTPSKTPANTPSKTPAITSTRTQTPTQTRTQTPTPSTPPPPALLFMESSDDVLGIGPESTDLATYMLANATGWFGFQLTGLPTSSDVADVLIWMDWPGFKYGTTNVPPVITAPVPQTTTGTNDAYGNPIQAYKFTTMQVPAGSTTGNIYYVILTPRELVNGGTQRYSQIGINYNGTATSLVSTNTDSGTRNLNLVYGGLNWSNTTYFISSNASGNGFNSGIPGAIDSTDNYFRAQSLI